MLSGGREISLKKFYHGWPGPGPDYTYCRSGTQPWSRLQLLKSGARPGLTHNLKHTIQTFLLHTATRQAAPAPGPPRGPNLGPARSGLDEGGGWKSPSSESQPGSDVQLQALQIEIQDQLCITLSLTRNTDRAAAPGDTRAVQEYPLGPPSTNLQTLKQKLNIQLFQSFCKVATVPSSQYLRIWAQGLRVSASNTTRREPFAALINCQEQ